MMAHSEICPVCGGSGKVKLDGTKWSEGKDQVKTCHGCNGRGWVEVQDSTIPYVPYVPPYDPCPYYPPYVPAPFDPGPWVAPYITTWENDTAVQKDFPQWTFTVWN